MSLKKEQRGKNISYPQNLLKALKYDIEVPTEDMYIGGTEPTSQNTIWLEVSE